MPFDLKQAGGMGAKIAMAFLAAKQAGPQAAAAFLRGIQQQQDAAAAQQYDRTRQNTLDQSALATQQMQRDNMTSDNALAQQRFTQDQQQGTLSSLDKFASQAADTYPDATQAEAAVRERATLAATLQGKPPDTYTGVASSVAPLVTARDRKRAQDILDKIDKNSAYDGYRTTPESMQQFDQSISVPWMGDQRKTLADLRAMVGAPNLPPGKKVPPEPKLQIVDLGGKKQVMDLNNLQAGQTFQETPGPSSGGMAGSAAPGAGGGLTPEGVDYAATQYRVTGQMPPLGMASAGARAAIVNAAAQQAKVLVQSPAVSIQKQAAYKADGAALTRMRTMSSAAESFETKAIAQADIVGGLSAKVNRTQFPIINTALLSGQKNIAGDQNTQLLFNAISTFTSEYAKIMEGSTGSAAAASDSARRAAAELVSAGLNKGTLQATLDLMKREMALTIQGYGATIDHITERMGGNAGAPAAKQADPLGIR